MLFFNIVTVVFICVSPEKKFLKTSRKLLLFALQSNRLMKSVVIFLLNNNLSKW